MRQGPIAHPVFEVAVLRGEPLLAAARLARRHPQAHRAAGRIDAEPGALVHRPEPRAPEVLLDGQVARHDDLVIVSRPRHARGLQHQRSQHQLLFGGGAGADEQALQLGARHLRHALHLVGRERQRHLRLEPIERDGKLLRIGRVGIGAQRSHRLRRLPVVGIGAAREPGRGHLVGLEDAVEAAELRRHVGDGEARIGGELPHTVAAVLDRSLHRHGVAAEQAERAQDHFLAAQPERQLPAVLDGDGLRHLEPGSAQHHGHHDVRAAQANGERAEPAVGRSVRIGSQHHVARAHQVPIEFRVQDGLVGIVEMADAALAGEVLRELHQLLRALVGGERHRIDGVIDGEKEAVLVLQPRAPEHRVGALHAVPGQLGGDRPVHGNLKDVARLHPGTRQVARVGGEDLLGQRHRARVHRAP